MRKARLLTLALLSFTSLVLAAQPAAPTVAPAAPAAAPVPPPVPRADIGAPRPEYFQFAHLHEMHRDRGRAAPVDLLFLGDSITEAWWNVADFWWKRYRAHQPANFGISGDRTQHVIWRLENGAMENIKPRVVVLHIGTNNTDVNTAPEIVAGIRRIIAIVQEKSPDTRFLLLAIFPRGPRTSWDGKPDNWEHRMSVIRAVNADLARLDDGDRVRFLDIGPIFLDAEGRIPAELMPDQLHLSDAAYARWADAMQPLLDAMLARP